MNNKKKLFAEVAVTFAVSGLMSLGLSLSAHADEPVQEVASSQVATSPETSTPTVLTESAPAVTSTLSDTKPEKNVSATSPATEELPVASEQPTESPASTSPEVATGNPATTPADHVDSAQDPAQHPETELSTVPATVDVPPTFDGWDTWLISADGSKTGPVGHVSVGEDFTPQSHLGSGIVQPQCNQLVQQDHYVGLKEQHDALLAAGDLTWTNGHMSDQNFGLQVADWNLVYGGDCPPPVVIPEKPPVTTTPGSETVKNCDAHVFVTHHWTITTDSKYDADSNTWVAEEPVKNIEQDTTTPTTSKDCPPVISITPTPAPKPTVKPTPVPIVTPTPTVTTTPAPVVLASDNQTPTTGTLAATGSTIDTILTIFGILALLGFICMVIEDIRRRRNAKTDAK